MTPDRRQELRRERDRLLRIAAESRIDDSPHPEDTPEQRLARIERHTRDSNHRVGNIAHVVITSVDLMAEELRLGSLALDRLSTGVDKLAGRVDLLNGSKPTIEAIASMKPTIEKLVEREQDRQEERAAIGRLVGRRLGWIRWAKWPVVTLISGFLGAVGWQTAAPIATSLVTAATRHH
ncbi:MAG: hypothetical protein ACYDAY_11380 [Candidatus Dormibacteria bacterium]